MSQTLPEAIKLLSSELKRESITFEDILDSLYAAKKEYEGTEKYSIKDVQSIINGFITTINHIKVRYTEMLSVLEAMERYEQDVVKSFKLKCDLCTNALKLN